MKVECFRKKLLDCILLSGRIASKDSTLPTLNAILFSANGSSLKLRATNLDAGIEFDIPAKVQKQGSVLVPSDVIGGFLSALEGDEFVKLEVVEKNLSITTKHNSTLLHSYPVDDFPNLPPLEPTHTFEIDTKELVGCIKSVWYSTSTSDIKPELASVLIYPHHNTLVFVATDSFRLAEKKTALEPPQQFPPILIPYKIASEVTRMFEGIDGFVSVRFNKNQISFSTQGIYFTSRLTDGVFPNYQQIIVSTFKTEAVVLKNDLQSSLKIAHIFLNKLNKVDLKISKEDKLFEIVSRGGNVGENTSTISAAIEGEDIEMSFNHRYVFEVFQSIGEDSVVLKFNSPTKPMVIEGVGNKTFTYLVMPMNR